MQPFVLTGTAEQIREVLCGPQQHNEHTKAWRWHMYVQDDKKRMANVWAEMRKMRDERQAREDAINYAHALASTMNFVDRALSGADRQAFAFDHARALRNEVY